MSAKEMFEELGYSYEKKKNEISIWENEIYYITFYLETEEISINMFGLDKEVIQAIQKQIEELGWV